MICKGRKLPTKELQSTAVIWHLLLMAVISTRLDPCCSIVHPGAGTKFITVWSQFKMSSDQTPQRPNLESSSSKLKNQQQITSLGCGCYSSHELHPSKTIVGPLPSQIDVPTMLDQHWTIEWHQQFQCSSDDHKCSDNPPCFVTFLKYSCSWSLILFRRSRGLPCFFVGNDVLGWSGDISPVVCMRLKDASLMERIVEGLILLSYFLLKWTLVACTPCIKHIWISELSLQEYTYEKNQRISLTCQIFHRHKCNNQV